MMCMTESPMPPSPGSVEHVSIDLVNSRTTRPGGKTADALETPEQATAWLIARDLAGPGAALEAYCRNRLAALREALAEVFSARASGARPSRDALERINAAITASPQSALLQYATGTGFFRATEHPATQLVEHAMSIVADDAATLLAGDDGSLLAQCAADPCTRFFLRTHARRQWCSTRCGDRVRAARAYARKHPGPAGATAMTA